MWNKIYAEVEHAIYNKTVFYCKCFQVKLPSILIGLLFGEYNNDT